MNLKKFIAVLFSLSAAFALDQVQHRLFHSGIISKYASTLAFSLNVDPSQVKSIPISTTFVDHHHFKFEFGGKITNIHQTNNFLDFTLTISQMDPLYAAAGSQLPWAWKMHALSLNWVPQGLVQESTVAPVDNGTLGLSPKPIIGDDVQLFFADARQGGTRWSYHWKTNLRYPKEKSGHSHLEFRLDTVDPIYVALDEKWSDLLPKPLPFQPKLKLPTDNNVVFKFSSLQNNEYQNVTFGQGRLYANDKLLSAKTDYFKSYFDHFSPKLEESKKVVEVAIFDEDVIQGLLQFIYTGAFDKGFDIFDDLYSAIKEAAAYYSVKHYDIFAIVDTLKQHWLLNDFGTAIKLFKQSI